MDYLTIQADNAHKWHALTENKRQHYQNLYEKDKIRRAEQLDSIREKGYFLLQDGSKSTEHPVKKPKAKRAKVPKKTADEEEE